ncbi:hypothetical protein ZWY2020_022689 [Hordeum vulgare]|nr:hypothetical protein ZWY2020_022689 [Hordeum vulgare]
METAGCPYGPGASNPDPEPSGHRGGVGPTKPRETRDRTGGFKAPTHKRSVGFAPNPHPRPLAVTATTATAAPSSSLQSSPQQAALTKTHRGPPPTPDRRPLNPPAVPLPRRPAGGGARSDEGRGVVGPRRRRGRPPRAGGLAGARRARLCIYGVALAFAGFAAFLAFAPSLPAPRPRRTPPRGSTASSPPPRPTARRSRILLLLFPANSSSFPGPPGPGFVATRRSRPGSGRLAAVEGGRAGTNRSSAVRPSEQSGGGDSGGVRTGNSAPSNATAAVGGARARTNGSSPAEQSGARAGYQAAIRDEFAPTTPRPATLLLRRCGRRAAQ